MPARPRQPPVPGAGAQTCCGCRTSPMSRLGLALSTWRSSSISYRPAHRRLAGEPFGPRRLRAGCAGAGACTIVARPVGGRLRSSLVISGSAISCPSSIPSALAEAGIEPSVGSVGDSYDNALAETINGLYKAEVIHRRGPWRSLGGRRVRHAGVGRLVQQQATARAHRKHSARRSRGTLLRHARRQKSGGIT